MPSAGSAKRQAITGASGLLGGHLGGRTRISRLQIGRRLAAIMERGDAMIRAVGLDAVATVALHSPNGSLDSRRAYGLGVAPERLKRALQRMVSDYRERCP